ncbi:MAG: HlyD family efflux transporter periplasmic adaptor subunit [Candidatus Brocadiae bacterium]|nr:HlyD family efflux transporter periplasmic adaptor subunit [Candidatus Brocadiia bacterium]
MKTWLKRLALLLVLAGAAGGTFLAFRPKPVAVDIARVERGAMKAAVEEDGRTRARERYTITAPIAGDLERIQARPGDAIEARDLLAHLLPGSPPLLDARVRAELRARAKAAEAAVGHAEAERRRSEAALSLAGKEFERQRELAAVMAIPAADLEEAEVRKRMAEQSVESARFSADVARYEHETAVSALARIERGEGEERLEIRSPIRGRVLRVIYEGPGPVSPGTPLLEIADPTALEVVSDLLTSDAVAVSPGSAALITGWGGAHELRGRVRLVEPSGFTKVSALGVEEQRVNVVIDLLEPPERRPRLGDGFSVNVAIQTWSADDVVRAPLSALYRVMKPGGAEWSVYVVEGGLARARRVEVGHRSGLEVEILSGLAAGESVVLHPGERVREGSAVMQR